ncbi:MAG: ABC transporter ATP-binding protein [Actinobacteria bacterium]|nr:ABC transporter ATP-binding protein [Actinomycetota bacterium]
MNILRVESLTQHFGALAAVDDLSFELDEGEVLGIAGPNGAGKSTLFNAITGFYKCTGDIYLEDHKISGLRPYQICQRGIGRTFQITQVFATLSVHDNLRIGAHFGSGARRAAMETRIEEMMEFVGLEGKADLNAGKLNLLDKKLCMLAAALLTRPTVLLVDEPTAGLSPTEVTEFTSLIKKVNEQLGTAVIIIEHLMRVLRELSHRMMIMENGRKVIIGSPEVVTTDEKVIEIYLGSGKRA